MAPKKKEEVKEKPILGRFRSNLKVMHTPEHQQQQQLLVEVVRVCDHTPHSYALMVH